MYNMKTWLLVHLDVIILKWKLGNWVILFFSGQKPCFRIISSILHPFLTLSEGYKSYKLYEITPNKRFLWEPEKTNFKSFKFHKMKSYAWWFYLCFPNSCEIWNLFSRVSIRNCLWRYYRWLIMYIALEKCTKKVIWPQIFWYEVFISWKLKLLSFLVDSVLIIYTRCFFLSVYFNFLFLVEFEFGVK